MSEVPTFYKPVPDKSKSPIREQKFDEPMEPTVKFYQPQPEKRFYQPQPETKLYKPEPETKLHQTQPEKSITPDRDQFMEPKEPALPKFYQSLLDKSKTPERKQPIDPPKEYPWKTSQPAERKDADEKPRNVLTTSPLPVRPTQELSSAVVSPTEKTYGASTTLRDSEPEAFYSYP